MKRKDSYTKEQIDYLYEIADSTGKTNLEITDLFNKQFNQNRSTTAIIQLKSRLGIKSYLRVYTNEQLEYLRLISPGRSSSEITKLFNIRFNENRTEASIKSIRYDNNILTGFTGRFEDGNLPTNTLDIGTEIERSDGYVYVKVDNPNTWKSKSRLIWESEHGKIPEDHVILFGDSNRRNFDIENLICISRKQLQGLNRSDLIQEDVNLTKTAINIVDLENKISEVLRNGI